ncbi:MAG TPA: ABC transporter permease [Blastocatellia bacterium]|nr:ABC transporter permease [Blastocatellia bacterium]
MSPSFFAVFHIELLFNRKRYAPYAMGVLFAANALLWWGWGAAVSYGWATNSEFYIVRNFAGFSFMTLPLFTALIMGDPVIRDFRTGIAPLIFSKPVSRATYLLGKFFGNFLVLVCCQLAFPLTLISLQWFRTSGMVMQPLRVIPYFTHFLLLVVISHFALAALYYTVGTLTRNVKIVYGLGVAFYPFYIAYQAVLLKGLPWRWRIALDPLLMNWADLTAKGGGGNWVNAESINQFAFNYNSDVIANRLLMIGVSLLCLTLLYLRFSTIERGKKNAEPNQTSIFGLAPKTERLYSEPLSPGAAPSVQVIKTAAAEKVAIPRVNIITQGWRASRQQFMAAFEAEFRLLRAERSLVVVVPLIMLLCGLELAIYEVVPGVSYSATYAGRTASTLFLFLFGVAVFYTGETMHRDRELRIEPLLWSMPAPSSVLLFSKVLTTFLLSIFLIMMVALTAIGLQIYKGHTPLQFSLYIAIHAVISVPSGFFMIAASVASNALWRDKYLAYAVNLGVGGALYYLISQGHNHPLYNPVLYQLWTPADFVNGGHHLKLILVHRVYCVALSALLLALALLCFERKSTKELKESGRLSDRGWTLLIAAGSALIAMSMGLMINRGW